jgi:hypothetical protein
MRCRQFESLLTNFKQHFNVRSFTISPIHYSIMKVIALLVTLFSVVQAKPSFTLDRALQTRGGAAIGPLDGDLVVQLSKTATTAYIAGSASKYITGQTGGTNTQVRTNSVKN